MAVDICLPSRAHVFGSGGADDVIVGGGGRRGRRTGEDKLPAQPRESIWTPALCSPAKVTGRRSLSSSLLRKTLSCPPPSLPVYGHHAGAPAARRVLLRRFDRRLGESVNRRRRSGVSFVFVLEDGGWNVGLHLVRRSRRRREKRDTPLLHHESLLLAGRGRARRQTQRVRGTLAAAPARIPAPRGRRTRVLFVRVVSAGLSWSFLHLTVHATGARCQPSGRRL